MTRLPLKQGFLRYYRLSYYEPFVKKTNEFNVQRLLHVKNVLPIAVQRSLNSVFFSLVIAGVQLKLKLTEPLVK